MSDQSRSGARLWRGDAGKLINVSVRCFYSLAIGLLLASCHAPTISGPLPQRGYLWQRAWNPAVREALREAGTHLSGLVILGGEMHWAGGKPVVTRANIDWRAVREAKIGCAVALRVAPYPGPFEPHDATAVALREAARTLLADARAQGVVLSEFQLDFDCASRSLAGYGVWLRELRAEIAPLPLVITALPAWLHEGALRGLLGEVDAWVLQVHSVPTRQEGGRTVLCDPALARQWVSRAARLGKPFSVALPTYRCLAGYDATGRLLSVAMDSVQPAWPPGTRTLDFATDAGAVAGLVDEWTRARPGLLREILWYRVPVATDTRNWTWPTLAAVMAGRRPLHRLEVVASEGKPVDLALRNTGEDDEPLQCTVRVSGGAAVPVAVDAVGGWAAQTSGAETVFTSPSGPGMRLRPGEQRAIGWLRYEEPPSLRFELREGP